MAAEDGGSSIENTHSPACSRGRQETLMWYSLSLDHLLERAAHSQEGLLPSVNPFWKHP